ncbi:MAG: hypothetical protein IKU44_04475 [Firmicutes bacterium]|nr:hypothetical protein [Bacillota bacterium]
MLVTYRERTMIDRFTCIDRLRQVRLLKSWEVGGLLYGYKDRFNVVSIEKEMIESIEY